MDCKFAGEILGKPVCMASLDPVTEWCMFWESCGSFERFGKIITDEKIDEINGFFKETDKKWKNIRFDRVSVVRKKNSPLV